MGWAAGARPKWVASVWMRPTIIGRGSSHTQVQSGSRPGRAKVLRRAEPDCHWAPDCAAGRGTGSGGSGSSRAAATANDRAPVQRPCWMAGVLVPEHGCSRTDACARVHANSRGCAPGRPLAAGPRVRVGVGAPAAGARLGAWWLLCMPGAGGNETSKGSSAAPPRQEEGRLSRQAPGRRGSTAQEQGRGPGTAPLSGRGRPAGPARWRGAVHTGGAWRRGSALHAP
jgi:hypothetical protein